MWYVSVHTYVWCLCVCDVCGMCLCIHVCGVCVCVMCVVCVCAYMCVVSVGVCEQS